jgi:type IV pilus assembly protein PilY1
LSTALFAGVLVGVTPGPAAAQAIITNGAGLALGLKATGAMNVPQGLAADGVTFVDPYNSSFVGLSFMADYAAAGGFDGAPPGVVWGDATSPGCLCEGWGVSADAVNGYDGNGFFNLTVDSFVTGGGGSTATSTTHLTSLAGLSIVHAYAPTVSPSLYEAVVSITNGTGADIADLRYRRVMDWDVPPTTFSELVTLQGVGLGDLMDSCDDGFETADPLSDCTPFLFEDVNAVDSGPRDHGASFTFAFGALAAGATKTFSIFYGAAADEAAALAALAAVGAEGIYSFGQNSSAGHDDEPTFIFGFGGVGAPPIGGAPEPTSLMLFGSGLIGALVARRYRNSRK